MSLTWHEARGPSRRGVAVVVHGLNNDPAVMDPLAAVLAGHGVECCRVSLYGEYDRNSSPEQVEAAWLARLASAREQAAERAGTDPTFVLAYSLGALVTLASLDRDVAPTVDRMVLIAPPVALTRTARVVRHVVGLRRFGVVLPSAAPRHVRHRWGTPLNEYAAMLELSARVAVLDHAGALGATPTTVVADPDDELVDLDGLRAWVEANDLDSWSVAEIEDRQPESFSYAHLLVTERALGRTAWGWLQGQVLDHLLARPT